MPICSICTLEKKKEDFPKAKTCVSGYRSYCRICKNKQTSSYYYKDKERHRQSADKWAQENQDKVREIKASWKKRNPVYTKADRAKRSAIKRSAEVLWDIEFTNFVFEEAHHLRGLRDASSGFKWHVDHVIPLQGKLVCGLHVWNNFAVIPAIINMRKNNKYAIPEERSSPI
jgi:hypothetical protein